MKFELNGTEIQKFKSPDISSTLKGYFDYSFTPNDLNELENSACRDVNDSENNNFVENEKFDCCIPLKHLFGFFEDYRQFLLN